MARAVLMQHSFGGGELSPRLDGRADIPKYGSGVSVLQNFVTGVQGPAVRRNGFRYVSRTLGSEPAVLVPFVVSDDESFVLSFTEGKIRFFTLEARLLDAGAPVEVNTPYLEAELAEIQYAQSVDVLYLVHRNHAPRKLSRISNTNWTLEEVEFFDGPWDLPNTTEVTLTYGTVTAGSPITVTASADTFVAGDVGRQVRLGTSDGTGWYPAIITAYTSPTVVTAESDVDTVGEASKYWRLGAWYAGNYPRAVTFNNQRLVFAGDPANAQTVYLSAVDDFENFRPTGETSRAAETISSDVADDNGFRLTLAANDVNPVQWLHSLRQLLLTTHGGLWEVAASSSFEPLTPSNAGAHRSTERGGRAVLPATIGNGVVYASATGRRLYRAIFSLATEAFVAEDLSVLADHLMTAGAKQLAWSSDPESTLWVVTEDGKLRGVTIDQQHEILAWHRHELGGQDVSVESVAVIPAAEGEITAGARPNERHDQLWVVVQRTVDGVPVRSVEFLEEQFADDAPIEDAFFVDSGFSYSGAALSTVTGLSHLEGEAVSVLADGSEVEDLVVAGGEIELPVPASQIHVGLPYTSLLRTLRLESSGSPLRGASSAQGSLKRIDHVTGRFFRTAGGEISSDLAGETFDPIDFEDFAQALGSPPGLYTGDVKTDVDGGWSTLGQVSIRQRAPLPMVLLALVHHAEVSDRGQDA